MAAVLLETDGKVAVFHIINCQMLDHYCYEILSFFQSDGVIISKMGTRTNHSLLDLHRLILKLVPETNFDLPC